MRKTKILVVDDDSRITNLIRFILEKMGGYLVREENVSQSAVTSALEFMPDVVLLDIDMPGLDGGDVADRLKTVPALANVPVVFVTSLISKDEAGSPRLKLDGDFVPKPINPVELIGRVRNCAPALLS